MEVLRFYTKAPKGAGKMQGALAPTRFMALCADKQHRRVYEDFAALGEERYEHPSRWSALPTVIVVGGEQVNVSVPEGL